MTDFTALIREFEGLRLKAYPDPLTGGEPITIGYGSTRYENNHKIKLGDEITQERAEKMLNKYVEKKITPKLEKSIPTWDKMNPNQKAAIISFAYNLGEHFYGAEGFATITRCLGDEDKWGDVPAALELYRNPGSNVEKGLLRRRRAEGALWGKFWAEDEPEATIDFITISKYYVELSHQKEALLWLTKKFTYFDRKRIARLWNSESDTVYTFDTYAKWFSATDAQIKAVKLIDELSGDYAHEFYKRWRNEGDEAQKIIDYMESQGYEVAKGKGEVNIIHIESRDFVPDVFNDTRMVITFDGSTPKIVGKWDCTTTPGTHYTKNPLNSKGAAIVKPGQYKAWQVGYHKTPSHPALVQTGGPVTVYRDFDRDYKRAGDKEDTGYFGINIHSTKPGYSGKGIGRYSAGCLTARDWDGHIEFMNLVKADPRYKKKNRFKFNCTLILEEDL